MMIALAVILFAASVFCIEHGHSLCSSIYASWAGVSFFIGGIIGIIASVVVLGIGL